MTDIDKIRKKFNQWNDPLNYSPYRTSELVEMAYLEAYKQGQRDLINSMYVVGYRYYVDKMDYWELVEDPVAHRICYPRYILPEDTTK